MEYEYLTVELAQRAPMRTRPMVRASRRLQKPVYRVYADWDAQSQGYERDWMDDDMSRNYSNTNEYGNDPFDLDSILTEIRNDEALFKAEDFDYGEASSYQEETPDEYDIEVERLYRDVGRRRSAQPRDPQYFMGEDDVPQDEPKSAPTGRNDAPTDDNDVDVDEPPKRKKAKTKLFGKKKSEKTSYEPRYKEKRETEEEDDNDHFTTFTDKYADDGGLIDVIDEGDYPTDIDDNNYAPPTFKEYVYSLVASFIYRIKGTHRGTTSATMQDEGEEEELGKEVEYKVAYAYYKAYCAPVRRRLKIGGILLAVMTYVSLGGPVPGMLAYLPVASAMCMAVQFTIMLLALDIVTNGILKIAHLRIGADSLAVIACLITSVDAAMVALGTSAGNHVPLCALSSLSLFGVMLSSYLSARALYLSARVPQISKNPNTIICSGGISGDGTTLLRTERTATGFIRRCEEAAPDETLFTKLSPFLLLGVLVLTIIVSLVTKNVYDVVYIFSALLSPAIPVTALLCFALPYCFGAVKLFKKGRAIAGWSGTSDIGQSSNLIVTDRDLFPEGTVEIGDIRIFEGADMDKVISYACSIMMAAKNSMSSAFARKLVLNNIPTSHVSTLKYLSGGGMEAIIDGHVVLCGCSDLMRLMNVQIRTTKIDPTTVLLAIDGKLSGVFRMEYKTDSAKVKDAQKAPETRESKTRKALRELMESNRHPIFAVRDFCITPQMLSRTFNIATDGYDFPPFVERYRITNTKPDEDSKVSAVICNEGLDSVASVANVGKKMYNATTVNMLIAVLSAVLGVLVVFFKMITTGSIGLGFILLYMLLTAIPVLAVSLPVRLK